MYLPNYIGPCADSFCYASCESTSCRPLDTTVCDECAATIHAEHQAVKRASQPAPRLGTGRWLISDMLEAMGVPSHVVMAVRAVGKINKLETGEHREKDRIRGVHSVIDCCNIASWIGKPAGSTYEEIADKLVAEARRLGVPRRE